ncbi:unnamed protein product [Fraxinus pennsylvanica]|uniref:Uncharacterized protein n=1 Tax=Fraxinus pennsylvanica TaxID=56036 RepID=A0AAD2AEJ7_9LAMI|nr:unnamed protein product [Fraxinus pennsylvanica]
MQRRVQGWPKKSFVEKELVVKMEEDARVRPCLNRGRATMINLVSTGVPTPRRLEGKYKAMVVTLFLGLGSLVSWNSMLAIGDYYYNLFPGYHPERVLTIVYQPFALGTMSFFAGLAASGALTSGLSTMTKAAFDKSRNGLRKGVRKYQVALIAMYNVLVLIGRYTPLVESIKLESRKGLLIASLLRFLLIPAFYFTSKYGDQGYIILLVSFLGLTNGHLIVDVLTAAPKGYKAPEQNALGNLLVLFLLFGIFSGVALDWLWIIGNGKF